MTDMVPSEGLANGSLSACARGQLHDAGFVVVAGPVPAQRLAALRDAYDAAMLTADPADRSVGRTTTRVHDFVNRGSVFDDVYLHPPLLEACALVIERPFKLSALLGRTLRPRVPMQSLHVDFVRDDLGWPMVGFILMLDDFRPDNGATRFVPGSHRSATVVNDAGDGAQDDGGSVPACGPAGSMILYNGSILHGHGANESDAPRRSLQGAYIRRDAPPGIDFSARMQPDTRARLTPLAKYLLGLMRRPCHETANASIPAARASVP